MSFTIHMPNHLAEALAYMASGDRIALAGGTDLMVWVAEGSYEPKEAVSLEQLKELKQIHRTETGYEIGSMVTFTQLLAYPELPEEYGAISEAAIHTGGPQIRNCGTIGGNICTASPAGDISCALVALDASVEVQNQEGSRIIPLKDFFIGPKRTQKKPDELLTKIILPAAAAADGNRSADVCENGNSLSYRGSIFEKLGKRNSLIIATANLCVYMDYQTTVQQVRIAVGSAAPVIVRASQAEASLLGRPLNADTIREACERLDQDICPITDLRATDTYRRKVCRNLLEDILNRISHTPVHAADREGR